MGWFLTFLGFLWDGIQTGIHYILIALQYSVQHLWLVATKIANGVSWLAGRVASGLRRAWSFLRATYDHVLRPAWEKFWHLVDRLRRTLENIFKPVLRVLARIREEVLRVYNRFVRPVLDIIGAARRVLNLLGRLGLEWAKKLDRKLLELEQKIYEPIQFVLGRLNEIINAVDRIMTLDGLFQRLALIRSLERDVKYAARVLTNARTAPVTDEDRKQLMKKTELPTAEEIKQNTADLLTSDSGPYAPIVSELTAQIQIWLRALG